MCACSLLQVSEEQAFCENPHSGRKDILWSTCCAFASTHRCKWVQSGADGFCICRTHAVRLPIVIASFGPDFFLQVSPLFAYAL